MVPLVTPRAAGDSADVISHSIILMCHRCSRSSNYSRPALVSHGEYLSYICTQRLLCKFLMQTFNVFSSKSLFILSLLSIYLSIQTTNIDISDSFYHDCQRHKAECSGVNHVVCRTRKLEICLIASFENVKIRGSKPDVTFYTLFMI